MARYMESGPEEDIFRTMGLGMHGLASISQALARRRRDEAEQKRQAASEARRAAQVERQFKMQQQELKARIGEREYNRKMDLYNQVARLTETYMRQNRNVSEEKATRHVIEAMKQAGFDVSGMADIMPESRSIEKIMAPRQAVVGEPVKPQLPMQTRGMIGRMLPEERAAQMQHRAEGQETPEYQLWRERYVDPFVERFRQRFGRESLRAGIAAPFGQRAGPDISGSLPQYFGPIRESGAPPYSRREERRRERIYTSGIPGVARSRISLEELLAQYRPAKPVKAEREREKDQRFGPITREERAAARRELEKRDFERWKKGF